MTAGTLLAVAALPVSLLAGNFRTNDHHNRTFEIRYFDSLFEMLPTGAPSSRTATSST